MSFKKILLEKKYVRGYSKHAVSRYGGSVINKNKQSEKQRKRYWA